MSAAKQTGVGRARGRQQPLLVAAAGLALIWIGILALSVALESSLFVALGASGLVLTAVAIGFVDRHQQQLRRLADTDPLTGLINHGGSTRRCSWS